MSGDRTSAAHWIVACLCVGILSVGAFTNQPTADDLALQEVITREAGGPWARSLFVHAADERWYPPLSIYPAAWLMRLGVSVQSATRLVSLDFALLLLLTTYAFMTRVDDRRAIAHWAVLLLAVTLAYAYSFGSSGADLLMVALVLFWCICVLEYVKQPSHWWLLLGGAALGLCAYTHPLGALTSAVFFIIGTLVLRRAAARNRVLLHAATGVLLMFVPIVFWLAMTPEAYPDTFGRWAIHGAHVRRPWDGLVASTRWHVLSRRVATYWDYLNPTFLFASGRMFGVSMLLLVPLGFWAVARGQPTPGQRIIVAGFFAAPLAGVLLDEPPSAALALVVVPFGAALGGYGVEVLRRSPRVVLRTLLGLVVLLQLLELTLAAK